MAVFHRLWAGGDGGVLSVFPVSTLVLLLVVLVTWAGGKLAYHDTAEGAWIFGVICSFVWVGISRTVLGDSGRNLLGVSGA